MTDSEPPAPLSGVAVELLDAHVATSVAGWWLRQLGAEVVVSDGGRGNGAVATFELGFRRDAGAEAEQAAGGAPQAGGAAAGGTGGTTPGAGRTSVWISAPDGPDDPCWEGAALWARSGLASLTRAVGPDGNLSGPPCVPRRPVALALAGMAAALVVAAWAESARHGDELPAVVEVDALELLCLMPMQPVAAAQMPSTKSSSVSGAVGERIGGVVQAADEAVYVRAPEPAQWQRLLAMVPGAERFAQTVVDDPEVLRRDAIEIDKLVRAWVAGQSGQEVVERCQAARVPLALMARPEQLVDDPHLRARNFYTGHHPRTTRLPWLARRAGSAESVTSRSVTSRSVTSRSVTSRFVTSRFVTSRFVTSRPSRTGRTAAAARPLAGVRVLDLSWAWAGPFATTLMAELGAEVVNVEWFPRPSNLRVQAPLAEERGFDASAWWSANQRGKASIGVDFKHPEGRQLILDLAAVSDVVVENFSPGVVDRLGIGFDDLSAVNDALVYVSMSAYGAQGPYAHFVGYGTQLYAASGFSRIASSAQGEASQMVIPLPDPISGLAGAVAAIAHVGERRAVHLDVSELEATCLALLDGVGPDMLDGVGPDMLDGVGPDMNDGVGPDMLDGVGPDMNDLDGLQYETRKAAAGRWLVSAVNGEPAQQAAVVSIAEMLGDERLVGRGFWLEDRAVRLVGRGLRIGAAPWLVDGQRPAQLEGAPSLFGDTRSVLHRTLGWSDDRIDALAAKGAIRTEPPS